MFVKVKALLMKSNRNICHSDMAFEHLKREQHLSYLVLGLKHLSPDRHSRRLQNSLSTAEICITVSVTRDR